MPQAGNGRSIDPADPSAGKSFLMSGSIYLDRWVGGFMGFDRPRRKMKPLPMTIGPHFDNLADYAEMRGQEGHDDVEAEQCTWPELIDQTGLARWCTRDDFDDAEWDDLDVGIDDEPHDAREEDGI